MFGKSWITTLLGSGATLAALICLIHKIMAKDWGGLIECIGLLSAGGAGIAAKQYDVTGGTVPATVEAEKRVKSPASVK
jgi:hypothetical protein